VEKLRKVPTLFRRDPENMARVLREVEPRCQWVLDGEGVATRKYDGTCVTFDDTDWWARREVKKGKSTPEGFIAVETDPATGKTVGWEPIEQSPFVKFWREAVAAAPEGSWLPGTYELCGPKVQGNPERYERHVLIRHEAADEVQEPAREFDALMDWLLKQGSKIEGIVWHHPDGRMAKLKVADAEAVAKGPAA
jgi:hypothetical protein